MRTRHSSSIRWAVVSALAIASMCMIMFITHTGSRRVSTPCQPGPTTPLSVRVWQRWHLTGQVGAPFCAMALSTGPKMRSAAREQLWAPERRSPDALPFAG